MSKKATQALGNKESDRLSNAGASKVYKAEKLAKEIRHEMDEDGVKDAVMDFIFGGNPEAVSPLQEIRDANE